MGYLTVSEFRDRTIMPQADVDQLELLEPNFLQTTLDDWSDEINSRLRKRYKVPFDSPYPRTILRWLTKLVTRDAYDKRGNNPSAQSDRDAIYLAAERVEKELLEAANSKDGLFELPLRDDLQTGGVSAGGPLGYSEISPWRGFDLEQQAASVEDANSGAASVTLPDVGEP